MIVHQGARPLACVIETATAADLPHVAEILAGAFAGQALVDPATDAAQLLGSQDTRVLLGRVDGQPIGVLVISLADPVILHGLGVSPPMRRQGYGLQLIQHAIQSLSASYPTSAVWTAIDPSYPDALSQFLRLGFVEIEQSVRNMRLLVLRGD